jgi:KAP family P-loop domain
MTAQADDSSLIGQLWSDDPARIDFLAARAIAATVTDVILDNALDPLSLGLSGPWGSGKTTVLELVEADLAQRSTSESKVVVVRTDPWRYDPAVGAKESIIADVLEALEAELERVTPKVKTEAKSALRKLAKRVDWSKAIQLAAKTGLALQLPRFEDLTDLIKEPTDNDDEEEEEEEEEEDGAPRGLAGFREDFGKLTASKELAHVRRVAVLVDDLDRCLPRSVVESLEAIRLFLSVPKMAFVIAADEERVSDAIKTELPEWKAPQEHERPGGKDALPPEPPSKLYLHKIVQTTVPLPALGAFDTEAYLLLLQVQNRTANQFTAGQLDDLIAECARLRAAGSLDELRPPTGTSVQTELAFAHKMTAILYQKLAGNPRRIKRFLNDMSVRRSIAARRGIQLENEVVAKLMVLEVLLPEQFKVVLSWLRGGELRDRLAALERIANNAEGETTDNSGSEPTEEADTESAEKQTNEGQKADRPNVSKDTTTEKAIRAAKETPAKKTTAAAEQPKGSAKHGDPVDGDPVGATTVATAPDPGFDDDLVRWAKLDPLLAAVNLSPYLHLAASFSGDLLVSDDLPQRLRDVAAQLTITGPIGSSAADKQAKRIPVDDASVLIRYFSRLGRDRIPEQRGAITAIGRLADAHPSLTSAALEGIKRIPAEHLQVSTAVHIRGLKLEGIEAVIADLASRASGAARNALTARSGPRNS